MTTIKPLLMTADEFLEMERIPGKRYELIRGFLTEQEVGTGDLHGATVFRTSGIMFQYTESTDYGEARAGEPGYRLESNPDTVRCPDVAWFAPGRIPPGTVGFPDLTPDLCVEVESPGNSRSDRLLSDKAQMWLNFGAREVWFPNPATVTVTRYFPNAPPVILGEDDILAGGGLLPDFSVPVWQLFRRRR